MRVYRPLVRAVFGSVPWQRCQFHLQQNAGQYVPTLAMRSTVAADIRSIFNAPDQEEAEHLLGKFLERYRKKAPKLATWAEENLPEGFTVFSFPPTHRRRLRTTNLVERLNEEIRRRTRVARLFPNEPASCLRLVTAVVMEIAEDSDQACGWRNFRFPLFFIESVRASPEPPRYTFLRNGRAWYSSKWNP